MHFAISSAALTAGFLFLTPTNAFWRMPCRERSGLARIDPLVSPGSISQHAHAIHGSAGFGIDASYNDLIAGSCTSCQVTQDKSAYWTPALYFQNAAGEFQLVDQVGGMLAYYLLYPNAGNTSLSAFPENFQMIAGNTNQRNFTYPVPDIPKSNWNVAPYNTQAFLEQAALGFNCLNYAITPEGSLYRHFLPDKAYLDANCLDGLRLELMFPSCWDGQSFEIKDQKEHVAYPSEVMTGTCPSGFPIRLPSLFYETIWNTYEFVGQAGQFLVANGDPTGFGYHGDFMMGWDPVFLQDAVNTCTNPSGQIEDCPLFNIQDEYTTCNITLPSALVSENVVGPISSLPGNVPIASGPAPANGATAGSPVTGAPPAASSAASAIPVPTLSYSAGQSLASTDTYIPGGIFAVSVPTSTTIAAPAITTPPVAAASNTESFFSTEYTTSGRAVLEVLWVEEIVTVTDPVTTTVVVPGRKRHLRRHMHGQQ
ncbi:hypothetical protein L207DRAFT_71340 [Hyaloscypha variabilis F]|uniref:DUF1996 domain-containing protein n=1 Tax=Hyaloscypha variabilis (strain UAMH 11265 / GT02V1 / F) TaxID=1149755 RepID=A0A2J6RF63_HYAVF|nr:hypothetical protein L207DRAFT_71340 [Hyaloscypha variabilis F]